MPNLDYYNTARMHQMVNSFQNILIVVSRLFAYDNAVTYLYNDLPMFEVLYIISL